MTFERRLQWALYGLIALSTFLLAMGDHDSPLPLAMLGVIPLSFLFVDCLGWASFFTRTVANWAALCGFVYVLLDITQVETTQSVIHLLLFLQFVLMLQEKNRRRYWCLLMLSVMQAVIAAVMNLHLLFGLLLFVYVGLGAWVLCLLSVWGEAQRWSPRAAVASLSATAALREGLWRPVLLAAGAATVFALVLYNAVPRLHGDQFSGQSSRRKLVGFSRELTLEEMTRILQSDALVMRVTLTDDATGRPHEVSGELYLRGTAFQRYATKKQGRWELHSQHEPPQQQRPPEFESRVNLVEQDIWLEPTPTATLFAIGPVFRTEKTPLEILFDSRSQELTRMSAPAPEARMRWQYRLGTTGLASGRQMALIPDPRFTTRLEMGKYYQEVRDCQSFDRLRFPKVVAVAEEALRAAEALDGDTIRKTRVLEAHFLQSNRYRYSLDMRLARAAGPEPMPDPIETFVGTSRVGHCQYFATALALMLRSQQIPARIVTGYHGGEYNLVGNYWQFRQRDAHAWVEVHLTPREVAQLNLGKPESSLRGGWWRIDPTPVAGRDQDVVASRWSQMLDYAEFACTDFLAGAGLDRPRHSGQNRLVEPLRERFAFLANALDSIRRIPENLRNLLGGSWWQSPGLMFSVLALALITAFTLRKTRHRWLPRFAHWKKRFEAARGTGRRRRVHRSKLEFFDRFELLIAATGRPRAASDTPREWLDKLLAPGTLESAPSNVLMEERVSERDDERPTFDQFTDAARRIVACFYSVRYGGAPLASPDQAAIDRALTVVAAFLRAAPGTEPSRDSSAQPSPSRARAPN